MVRFAARQLLTSLSLILLAAALACRHAPAPAQSSSTADADLLVYGATPAGIAAALAAARLGRSVWLIEERQRIGGMLTNGLSHSDFRTFEGITGTFGRLTKDVHAHYARTYGPTSPQTRDSLRGTHAEPKVNHQVLSDWLAAEPRVRLLTRHRLVRVERNARRIVAVHLLRANGSSVRVTAAQFIDATYEGDLMALAGERYRIGREARSAYGESLAPEQEDRALQAYNFRLTMTRDPGLRAPVPRPPGYRREDFVELLPWLREGRFEAVFCERKSCIYKAQRPALPNAKVDVNDMSQGLVRLSLPGLNAGWPEGDMQKRAGIFAEHLRHNVGLLHFLQTDDDVPDRYREEAASWGLCRDELVDSAHLPEQLYVREARRLLGARVFTQHDAEHAAGDARAVLHRDAIAMGDYGLNSHGTGHEGPRLGGRHTGEFYKAGPPYQIPLGVIVPRATDNLLVPVAMSASHVGFAALRLEPIWTSLGHAAGIAAHVALEESTPVQAVSVARVQTRLHAEGAATIYVSDVGPEHPDFAAVQWWGTAGGLHGLEPAPPVPGQRGRHLLGQYFEAYPDHAARLDLPLDPTTRDRWLALARALAVDAEVVEGARTRGDFVRRAHGAVLRERTSSPGR